MTRTRSILGLALSCSLLLAGPAVEPGLEHPTAPWPWHINVTIQDLGVQPWLPNPAESPRQRKEAFQPHASLRLAGSATVEVWGNEPQEAMNLVRELLYPELRVAFQTGWSGNVSKQICGEIFAMATSGQEIKAPSTPSSFYNCLRPSGADPKLKALLAYTSIQHP